MPCVSVKQCIKSEFCCMMVFGFICKRNAEQTIRLHNFPLYVSASLVRFCNSFLHEDIPKITVWILHLTHSCIRGCVGGVNN